MERQNFVPLSGVRKSDSLGKPLQLITNAVAILSEDRFLARSQSFYICGHPETDAESLGV